MELELCRAIAPEGPLSAVIAVIGEAPGAQEVAQGRPFVGAAGRLLHVFLKEAGLSRSDLYLDNLVQVMPPVPQGDMAAALKTGALTQEYLHTCAGALRARIAALPDLRVVVSVGNYATWALTGRLGKTPMSPRNPGITEIRGSQEPATIGARDVIVVPVIHPAAILRNKGWEARTRADWQKIAGIAAGPVEVVQRAEHYIHAEPTAVQALRTAAADPETVMAVDIETWGGKIQVVGFSWDPMVSVSLHMMRDGMWDIVHEVCHGACQKVTQGGLYDAFWLADHTVHLRKWFWDTMAMHCALHPIDSHSLEYLASRYLQRPAWKGEAKDADEIVRDARQGMDKLLVYNGIDCTVTRELFDVLYDELLQEKQLTLYIEQYANMFEPILSAMRLGILVDPEKRQRLSREQQRAAVALRNAASHTAGRTLWTWSTKAEEAISLLIQAGCGKEHVCTALSTQFSAETLETKWKVIEAKGINDRLLGDVLLDWKARGRARTGAGQIRTDNVALKRLTLMAAESGHMAAEINELVWNVIAHRKAAKMAQMVAEERIDADGRLRCAYKFTPWTGRLSSSKNPHGTGRNLQNITRELRQYFVASPGNVLLEIDQSQAEARVVYALTGDPEMLRIAQAHPSMYDWPVETARLIYGHMWQRDVAPHEVTPEMRQLGEHTSHAAHYGEGPRIMSDRILKDTGDVVLPEECKALLGAYLTARPAIVAWQAATRDTYLKHGTLWNSWGRTFVFPYARLDDQLYKKLYAAIPQSEVAVLNNMLLWQPLYYWLKKEKKHSRIILQVHDSIVVDARPEEVYAIMAEVSRVGEVDRFYGGYLGLCQQLVIWLEYTLGRTWQGEYAWKGVPLRAEVDEALVRLS